MDQMRLGNSDVMVPPIALGTMYFGSNVDPVMSHAILDAALDAGVTFWDTANNYAFWVDGGSGDESEKVLGQWLAARPGTRDRVTLATKIGARPRPGARSLGEAIGLSASAVREQVEDSLARLGTDHVDVLYAHIDDTSTPAEETVRALQDEIHRGTARAIACSNTTTPRLSNALRVAGPGPRYVAVQQRFTYLRPREGADLAPHVLLEDDLAELCTREGVSMLGYSPLLGGAYTRRDRALPQGYQHPATSGQLATLAEAAATSGLDAGQVALAWMPQRTVPVIPVVGVSSLAQLHSAAQAVATPLPAAAIAALDRARNSA